MKRFKGMTFEQCVKYVKNMTQQEKLDFFTVRLSKMNPYSDKLYSYLKKSLPDLIIVHPWWGKIEMINYREEFFQYYN